MQRIASIFILITLSACGFSPKSEMSGPALRVKGASYEEVWKATSATYKDHYGNLGDEDKKRGEILMGGACAMGPTNYVGFFILPPKKNAPSYVVKVVAPAPDEEVGFEERTIAYRNEIAEKIQASTGLLVERFMDQGVVK
jgi:hypothetical protein